MRLFYTETNLGWNSEEWPVYLRWAIPIALCIASFNALVYYTIRRSPLVQRHWRILLIASLLTAFLAVVFFFSAGRVSMLPMAEGVHEMNKYGCCAQGIVYPRNKVPL